MKNNIENGIYIPEEQRNLIPVDEWVKREDPTTAQTVVLVTDFGMLEIAKEDLPGGFNFEGAQKAAARASAARPGMKQLKCTTPGSVASTKRSRRSAANPQRLSAGRAKPTPTRSTIPAARSSTAATRAAWATTASVARTPCVRFPLSRNSFTVQSFPRPLRGAGLTPKTKQK